MSRKISEYLKEIRENPDKRKAICANVGDIIPDRLYMKWSLIKVQAYADWGKYSGDTTYPIPSTKENFSRCEMFSYAWENENFWDRRTKYGKLRHELLDHLIQWFEKHESK